MAAGRLAFWSARLRHKRPVESPRASSVIRGVGCGSLNAQKDTHESAHPERQLAACSLPTGLGSAANAQETGPMSYQDRELPCVECGKPFTFSADDQSY